jgi:hypothetical protein
LAVALPIAAAAAAAQTALLDQVAQVVVAQEQ